MNERKPNRDKAIQSQILELEAKIECVRGRISSLQEELLADVMSILETLYVLTDKDLVDSIENDDGTRYTFDELDW